MSAIDAYPLINSILAGLFSSEENYLSKLEKELILKNASKGGSTDGFRHMGVVYTLVQGAGRRRVQSNLLSQDLVPEMDQILKQRQTISIDKSWVKQALFITLKDCHDWQDVRDALPNGLQQFIPECRGLARTRPEAFTISNNPRAMEQYQGLRDKIEYYTATQLFQ